MYLIIAYFTFYVNFDIIKLVTGETVILFYYLPSVGEKRKGLTYEKS